jgi:toxin YoeB
VHWDIEKHRKAGDKATLQKIEQLLNELREHPTTGTGQPEKLKYNLAGFYSRRINKKYRLVYLVEASVVRVLVVSAWSHYGDK